MIVASWVLIVLGTYAAIGLVFAIVFLIAGITRVDPAATHSRWTFRLLILPGIAAFWPLVLRKWLAARLRHAGAHP